jgi:type III secretory pathway component EscR
MTRFAAPLFVLVSLYAGAVSASSVAAPASCDGFLKRACTKQEQTYFDKAAKKPVASKQAQGTRDCDSFLKRTCSKQEQAHFAKGMQPLNARSTNVASSCDSFLKRTCSKHEKLSFAKGTQAHLTLASK